MSSYSSTSSVSSRSTSAFNFNTVSLLGVAVLCFLFAQQVATGWLALGERLNISRRDFNLLEIVVMVGGVLWGLVALWTVVGLGRQGDTPGIRAYFDDNTPMPPGLRFAVLVLGVVGVVCLFIAAQILTGWLPLGERANISRLERNWVEWSAIALSAFWGVLCLRTVLGFVRRERPAWSWAQWALFLTAVASVVILMSGTFEIPGLVPRGGLLINHLAGVLDLTAPGLVALFSSLVAYRIVTVEYGAAMAQKVIAGSLAERAKARDVSRARVPAGQEIRNRLAQSPGAGAIIGFIALFTFFTVASDLFLNPQSLAGALTNNVTRGVVAIGTTMLMISGEFDLSVGSLLGIAGLTFVGLMTGQFPPGLLPPLDPLLSAIGALVFVGFLGSINGLLLIWTGIPSFIVTLATQLILRGIPLVFIAGGANLRYVDYFSVPPLIQIWRPLIIVVLIVALLALAFISRSIIPTLFNALRARWKTYPDDPDDFRTVLLIGSFLNFAVTVLIVAAVFVVLAGCVLDQITLIGQSSDFLEVSFFDLMNGRVASLPFIGEVSREINLRMGVFWWFALVIIFQFVLNQTRYGNATFAVGGNPGAARAQGINVNRVKVMNYILVAVMAAIAGIFDASRLQSIDALRGRGLELEVIAATVIGGALLTGGYGSMIGALLGVFIFGMMQTGLVLIGVDARLFDAFIGFIILAAVIINTWSRRIKS